MTDRAKSDVALLRVDQVAGLIMVSNKTVRRWIAANELAVVRFGRTVRISEAELARFIAARTFSGTNPIGN
jgi:excisionase family DNA binding protein